MDYLRYFLALFVVLGLLGLLGLGLRKYGMTIGNVWAGRKRRSGNAPSALAVKDSLMLDPRRRLLLIEWNGEEHLLLLGPNGDMQIGSTASTATSLGAKSDDGAFAKLVRQSYAQAPPAE